MIRDINTLLGQSFHVKFNLTSHFHKLENKGGRDLEGYFAIDVKSRRDQWRIILEPLDENKKPYVPCNIDEISQNVRIVEIMEVSKHYE